VPEAVLERLERIKDSEEEVRSYAVEFGVAMCRRLLELGAPDLHFYTLNAAAITTAIINQLQPVRISM
jgi:methylenetetrahydrofolate reductase (NADPH)